MGGVAVGYAHRQPGGRSDLLLIGRWQMRCSRGAAAAGGARAAASGPLTGVWKSRREHQQCESYDHSASRPTPGWGNGKTGNRCNSIITTTNKSYIYKCELFWRAPALHLVAGRGLRLTPLDGPQRADRPRHTHPQYTIIRCSTSV